MQITYTFPAAHKIAELAGKTFTGGTVCHRKINKNDKTATKLIDFHAEIFGKNLLVIVAGKPEIEAQLTEIKKQDDARFAAQMAAQAEYEKTPRGYRAKLSAECENTYSENHYPGTNKWFAHKDACDALKKFDAEHADLAAQIDAEWAAREAARYDALSDFVKMGS